MVFGIIGMVNFAHGDVFMVSSFTRYRLSDPHHLDRRLVALALVVVLIVAMILTFW